MVRSSRESKIQWLANINAPSFNCTMHHLLCSYPIITSESKIGAVQPSLPRQDIALLFEAERRTSPIIRYATNRYLETSGRRNYPCQGVQLQAFIKLGVNTHLAMQNSPIDTHSSPIRGLDDQTPLGVRIAHWCRKSWLVSALSNFMGCEWGVFCLLYTLRSVRVLL